MQYSNAPGMTFMPVRVLAKSAKGVVFICAGAVGIVLVTVGTGLLLAAEVAAVPIAAGAFAKGSVCNGVSKGAHDARCVMFVPISAVGEFLDDD